MDINVKINIELGEKTLSILSKVVQKAAGSKISEPLSCESKVELGKKEVDLEQVVAGWSSMNNDSRLEAINGEVKKFVKQGKGNIIKDTLSCLGISRVSKLSPRNYEFFLRQISSKNF